MQRLRGWSADSLGFLFFGVRAMRLSWGLSIDATVIRLIEGIMNSEREWVLHFPDWAILLP